MLKRMMLVGLLVPMCAGVSCQVTIPDDDDDNSGGVPGYVQLDRVTAEIQITAAMPATMAHVSALLRKDGTAVELKEGQQIFVNGLALEGPDVNGLYSRSIPRAAAYVIKVSEPTLGSYETTVQAPSDFTITSPTPMQSVSLAGGFPLTWTNPSASVTTRVKLSQVLGSLVSEVVGPFADEPGTLDITAANLMKFRQGADLNIAITRTSEASQINGLAGGTVRVELSEAVSVLPAP